MASRTRYFVILSLLVLTIGLGTGLVAYYSGFATSALSGPGGPAELRYVPANAAVVAYADVHEIMTSDVRQRIRAALPDTPRGREEFQDHTGINIETDIDHIVACAGPHVADGTSVHGSGMVLARGRFDAVKIEALMREHGGRVEEYKGKRLIVSDPANTDGAHPTPGFSVAFLETDLIAVGTGDTVRGAVDVKDGGASVLTNDEMMAHIRGLDSGNAWAAGRFDVLTSQAKLPSEIANRLPPITWFGASADINAGIRAALRAEARDEESGNNLRDVVRGFMALAKMQAGSRPEFESVLQSLQLSGTGKDVAVSVDLPLEVFDAMAALASQHRNLPRPQLPQ